jgi:hypothetical protein
MTGDDDATEILQTDESEPGRRVSLDETSRYGALHRRGCSDDQSSQNRDLTGKTTREGRRRPRSDLSLPAPAVSHRAGYTSQAASVRLTWRPAFCDLVDWAFASPPALPPFPPFPPFPPPVFPPAVEPSSTEYQRRSWRGWHHAESHRARVGTDQNTEGEGNGSEFVSHGAGCSQARRCVTYQ